MRPLRLRSISILIVVVGVACAGSGNVAAAAPPANLILLPNHYVRFGDTSLGIANLGSSAALYEPSCYSGTPIQGSLIVEQSALSALVAPAPAPGGTATASFATGPPLLFSGFPPLTPDAPAQVEAAGNPPQLVSVDLGGGNTLFAWTEAPTTGSPFLIGNVKAASGFGLPNSVIVNYSPTHVVLGLTGSTGGAIFQTNQPAQPDCKKVKFTVRLTESAARLAKALEAVGKDAYQSIHRKPTDADLALLDEAIDALDAHDRDLKRGQYKLAAAGAPLLRKIDRSLKKRVRQLIRGLPAATQKKLTRRARQVEKAIEATATELGQLEVA
jgi:hypothetical protein